MQRVESWDLAYDRLFGRGAEVAQFAFNLAFGLAIFHPSWFVKLLGILALLGAARGVGSWERRQAVAAGEPKPVSAPLPSQEAARTGEEGEAHPQQKEHNDDERRAKNRQPTSSESSGRGAGAQNH